MSQLLIFLFLISEFIMQTYFDQVDRVRLPDPKPIIRWRFATIIG